MKREIICVPCSKEELSRYPDEGWKKVLGKLLHQARCDACNVLLNPGAAACALSMYVRGAYFRWEHEYLTQTTVGDSHEG